MTGIAFDRDRSALALPLLASVLLLQACGPHQGLLHSPNSRAAQERREERQRPARPEKVGAPRPSRTALVAAQARKLSQAEPSSALARRLAQAPVVGVAPDLSALGSEEREVLRLLVRASALMNEVYLRQRHAHNADLHKALEEDRSAGHAERIALFEREFGPWDHFDADRPFVGTEAMPAGAGFYPEDLTRGEFERYLTLHPRQKAALLSPYTVVRRDGDRLTAVSYSIAYRKWLRPAAKLLEKAAKHTQDQQLRHYLMLRAGALMTDIYSFSDGAWSRVQHPRFLVDIGPAGRGDDHLMGIKASLGGFVAVAGDDGKAQAAGGACAGGQAIAGELVHAAGADATGIRAAHALNMAGAKPAASTIAVVCLDNVAALRTERLMRPVAQAVLVARQAGSLAPGVVEQLASMRELERSALPPAAGDAALPAELRADIDAAARVLEMQRASGGEAADATPLLAAYVVSLFQAMREGGQAPGARAALVQYTYLRQSGGGLGYDAASGRFVIDPAAMGAALARARARLAEGSAGLGQPSDPALDGEGARALSAMADLPRDLAFQYPAPN
ncbi:hypothetical protein [Novosphingobium resinovorum]|uniref:hypothetical protein n=1 Tax=Novosphingobium resinovorum TaxID=158500 RepID=UPI002ED225BA|nr:hypothetical protein [Novosphingobium resinovorum]